jgi:hypothetical protein
MNFQTMNRQRKLILIAAAIGIISVFLPWITISMFGMNQNINGFHGWGILAFLAFVVTGVVALVGNQTSALDKGLWFLAIACGAVALLSVIIAIASSSGSPDGGLGLVDAGIGVGTYMAIATSLAIVIIAWIFRSTADNLKSGFEGLKKSISIPATSFSGTNTHTTTSSPTNKIVELERLSKLKENGNITEDEFQQLKSKLI